MSDHTSNDSGPIKPDQINNENTTEEKSFFSIIVHSFFIIPFLIAVFCVVLFAGMHLLTREKRSVYDYLEDVKTGGLNKRWQGAFELSKILANPDLLPQDDRFLNELINAFEHAQHDDGRIRQYLALAMGRTKKVEFLEPLLKGLKGEKETNLPALIYALGMLENRQATTALYEYLNHPNARIRSIATVSLGNIADKRSIPRLKNVLKDTEPNVQWGAAISLAKLGDGSGKSIIKKLLDREYLSNFQEVDRDEQNHLILAAIEASARLNDSGLNEILKSLSTQDQNMKVRAAALDIVSK